MFFVLILAAVCLVLYYLKIKYFTLRDSLPGLSPHFLFGNLIQSGLLLQKVSLAEALLNFKALYGDTYQFWLGPMRNIVVSGIGDVQHIFTHRNIYDQGDLYVEKVSVVFPDGLLCIKGAKFKRHAALIMPLFRRGKIVSNLDLIVDCTDKLLAKWRINLTHKIHTDVIDQCRNLLLAIFGSIAFDYDLETLNSDDCETKNELTEALRYIESTLNMVFFAPVILTSTYLMFSPRYRKAKALVKQYLDRMVEKEQSQSEEFIAQRKRTSLIASFVSSLEKDEQTTKNEDERKGLSREELYNELLLMLTVGYDTTATSVGWFIHLMSKHPHVQDKIKEEMRNNGEQQHLSLEYLDSLVYLDCVVNEVFRFCPPASGTFRTLTVDDRLPESGVKLQKGDQIYIPFHNLTRDPRYWSIDPELFCPERFLGEDKNPHPYAFIPFGSGHRQCVGQDLARFEFKVIAARLMQYVTFGDGGCEVNAGGHSPHPIIAPKYVGVTIEFDQ